MGRYHLVRDGLVVASRDFDDAEGAPQLAPNKGAWLPEGPGDLDVDPATEVEVGEVFTVSDAGDAVIFSLAKRPKTPDELAADRAAKVEAVKAEASRRILALFPDWKQRNMTARGVDLVNIRLGRDWTGAEAAEAAELEAAWAQIRAVRERSDALEAALPADPQGVAAFDPLAGWE